MQRDLKRYTIPSSHAGQRLDQVLPELCPELSRTYVRKLIDFGGVHLNGRRVRSCSQAVVACDRIEIHIDGLPLRDFVLSAEQVIFQDRDLLVINKPAGVDSQPTPARFKGTVYSGLLAYLADPFRRHQKPSLGMLQRLDRETSGLMVFSIHPRAHKRMTAQFASRTIVKRYLALVAGRIEPPEGEIRSMLAKNRATNLVKSVEKGGREAITRYRAVARTDSASLLEVELLTGRSHQIRAHFSERGHPLLGDHRYGGPSLFNGVAVERQQLHAWRLGFEHPLTGEALTFEAPPPSDISYFAQQIQSESVA